jgi:acetyl esterase/lipase
MAANFLQGADPTNPLASPLFADLAGVPPVQVEISGRDGIREDARRLAAALADAGVEVTVDECDGAIHGYHMFAPHTPEAQVGTTRLANFLNAQLAD